MEDDKEEEVLEALLPASPLCLPLLGPLRPPLALVVDEVPR